MKCFPWFLHRITRLAIYVWRRQPDGVEIPVDVAHEETIVRISFYPQTLEKNSAGTTFKLKKNIFRSPPGEDEVSVIRRTYVSDQFCKDKAKDIELSGLCRGEGRKEFQGFTIITALKIRELGSQIVDSRSEYVGHAHISHGFVVQRDEPLPPQLNERLDALKKAAKYIADPLPRKWGWTGPPLI
jgi:hypothetical protein